MAIPTWQPVSFIGCLSTDLISVEDVLYRDGHIKRLYVRHIVVFSERVAAILEMPASELISKLPPSILTAPAVDGDIISSALTYTQVGSLESTDLPGKSWCSDLLIGDAEADVRIVHTSRSVYLLINFPPKIGQHI